MQMHTWLHRCRHMEAPHLCRSLAPYAMPCHMPYAMPCTPHLPQALGLLGAQLAQAVRHDTWHLDHRAELLPLAQVPGLHVAACGTAQARTHGRDVRVSATHGRCRQAVVARCLAFLILILILILASQQQCQRAAAVRDSVRRPSPHSPAVLTARAMPAGVGHELKKRGAQPIGVVQRGAARGLRLT